MGLHFFLHSFFSSSTVVPLPLPPLLPPLLPPRPLSSLLLSSSSSWGVLPLPAPRPVPHSKVLPIALPLPLLLPPLPLPLITTRECRSRGAVRIRCCSDPKGSSPQGSPARHRGQPELYLLLIYPHMHRQHPGAFPHCRQRIAWCISSWWQRRHLHRTTDPGISSPQAGGTQILCSLLWSHEGGGVEENGPSPS